MTEDRKGAGHVWSTSLHRELGAAFERPIPVVCLDKLIIVVKRRTGLRFDENLPSFHLYGADIVLSAQDRGLNAYAIDAPVIHNSRPVTGLDAGFVAAYRHMQNKWRSALPVSTTVVPVTSLGYPLFKSKFRFWLRRRLNRFPETGPREDAVVLARRLGYE